MNSSSVNTPAAFISASFDSSVITSGAAAVAGAGGAACACSAAIFGKAIWSIFIIFLPFLGIFAYVIARGGKMSERSVKAAQANEAAMQSYIRDTAAGGDSASQLATLADLHTAGKLDDAEYSAAKAKIIA